MLKSKTHILLPVLCLLCSLAVAAKDKEPAEFARQSSLIFIENKGQITDQHGAQRKDIDFKLETPAVNMFIGKGHMHYQWTKTPPAPLKGSDDNQESINFKTGKSVSGIENQPSSINHPTSNPDSYRDQHPISDIETYRLDVTLIGANPNAQLITADADPYYENYYLPHLGENGAIAKSYRKIIYKNIYPNIDWVIYTSSPPEAERQGGAKYDFIIHPGGNPKDIQLRYDGATELKLDNGNITATTPFGSITENAPYTYNAGTKEQIASSFVLNDNILSFQLAPYTGTIVIDPQLHWATYYGGSGHEYNGSICSDSSKFIYVSGSTTSASDIATTGAYQVNILGVGKRNPFVAKFNSSGIRIWATYYYMGNDMYARGVTYSNAVYAIGECYSCTDTAQGGHQQLPGGAADLFLIKFDTLGNKVWSTYYGGSSTEMHGAITASPNGNIIISGSTISSNNIATSGSHQPALPPPSTTQGHVGAFLASFSSAGVRQWGTYYAGQDRTWSFAVATDRLGNIYMAGMTYDDSLIATTGAHNSIFTNLPTNSSEGYLAKFNSSGTRLWGTYYGDSSNEYFNDVTCDLAGNVYGVGHTTSKKNIATNGTFQTTYDSLGDGLIVKFDSLGTRQWGTYYGGNRFDEIQSIISIGNADLYLSGITKSTNNIATSDAYINTYQGIQDAFLIRFNTSGDRIWGTYFGGPQEESQTYNTKGLCAHKNMDIFLCGNTFSTNGIATPNTHQYYLSNGLDAFIAKFTGDTLVSINKQVPGDFCVGDTVYISYRTTYPFANNNIFSVQLSDSSGSFLNHTTIGSLNATTTDSIVCVIPVNTIPGINYRIRIVASSKADTSLQSINKITIGNVYAGNLAATVNSPVCLKDSIKLSATSTSQGVLYSWTGPAAFTSTLSNPSRSNAGLSMQGNYIVTANLFGCKSRDTVSIIVQPLPYTGNMSSMVSPPVCERDTVFLGTASGVAGTTYIWTGPASFNATVQNPFIVNPSLVNEGKYVVTANLNGCIQKDSVIAVIKPLPANLTVTSNAPFCTGNNLLFNAASSSTGVTYAWSGPNSFTSTSATPFISSATPVHNGDYYVAAALNGCTARDTVTVLIYPIPVKPVLSASSPLCVADSLHLSGVTTTTGVSYSWTGPNSYAGSSADTSFLVTGTAISGIYQLAISKNGCVNADTISVMVKPLPAPVTVSNNGPLCAGDTLKLLSGSSSTGVTYAWAGPNSFSAATQNAFITNSQSAASGWYRLVLNLNGCLFKDSTSATVHPIPVISNTAANTPLCIGETLSLSTGNITGASFAWTGVNNFSSSLQNPSRGNIQFGDTGWYKVAATVNGCISPVDSIRITANPLPFVVIFANKDSLCVGEPVLFTALPNNAGGSPVYAWKVNAQPAGSGSSYASSSLNNGDIVSCEMTDNTKCSAPYTDPSNDIQMKVFPWLAPAVTITANPTGPLKPYQYVAFTANVTNGGNAPTFQWKRNGQNVQGATSAVWSANTLNDNDSISVEIISNYKCPQPAIAKSNGIRVKILTGITGMQPQSSIVLYPNPNKGGFTLSGQLINQSGEAVQVEVINTLGQVVYQKELQVLNGNLDAHIQLGSVAPGTYLLRIHNSSLSEAIRFTVQ